MNSLKRKLIYFLLSIFLLTNISCSFFNSFTETKKDVKNMTFDKSSIELYVGTMDLLNLKIDCYSGQSNVSVSWEYDTSVIEAKCDNFGIVITALHIGTSVIRANADGFTATCTVRVLANNSTSKVENPYVYVSQDYITVLPGETEKVFASLYGGTQSDINSYSFSIDQPSIASLYTEGNYCWITGISEGLARITARNSKSSFGYSFLVNCSGSLLSEPYITTDNNIITINKSIESTSSFEVDLVNAPYPTYADDFTYSIINENDEEIFENIPIQISYTGNKGTITALNSGSCYLKVSHKECKYSFNILVRIVENIDTAYIEPSCGSLLKVNGTNSETFSLEINGIDENTNINPNDYIWSFSDNADDYIDYRILGGSDSTKGDNIWITGKKSGSVKITVSHPLCSLSRSIIVLVRNVASEASTSTVYITTSQDYIQTSVGAEASTINVTINNLSSGDENNLQWSIVNEASDGSKDPVIIYQSGTGLSTSNSLFSKSLFSKSAISMSFGTATITPIKQGKATIIITHPKAAYPTKILVNVTDNVSTKNEFYTLSSNFPFLNLLSGESSTLKVTLSGFGKTDADDFDIKYSCNSSAFSLSPNGSEVIITSNGTGNNQAILKIEHEKVKYPIEIRLLSKDESNTEIPDFKFIYLNNNAFTISTNENINIHLLEYGTNDSDSITWTLVSGNSIIDLENISRNECLVKGLTVGVAEIKATLVSTGESLNIYVNVKQQGVIVETLPSYLTTTYNVVTMNKGDTSDICVNPINISTSEFSEIEWKNNNPELFEISTNGENSSLFAKEEGAGSITITHPLSKNILTINVHIGSEYVYHNSDVSYISTNTDTLLLKSDSLDTVLDVVVAHTESDLTERSGFSFTSSDISIFTAEFNSLNSYCIITPHKAGQGILTIRHDGCEDKELVVIIEKSDSELENVPYLSTSQNVLTVIAGEYVTASACLKNKVNFNTSDWYWKSDDSSICDTVVNSGSTCMISGIHPGTTKVKITHKDCMYPIEIIVICLDSDIVQSKPWINTSVNIINLNISDSISITADMIGGSEADDSSFIWSVSNSSIALVNGSGSTCFIKGLKKGFTSLQVRNLNYPNSYQKTVFIRVEENTDKDCYITVSDKIIKLLPSDLNGITVTATLENEKVLDAQDFVWWADDYKLVNLISNTDKCQIIPNGIQGSTTVHLKHPKVLNPIDIIVMLTNYDSFAFDVDSMQIQEKAINFITMQVPTTIDDSWIEFCSDNSNICAVTGSDSVCMIAGVNAGYTTIHATLNTTSGIIDTADMAIIVSDRASSLNTISMESSIINMEMGESQTLEAVLNGQDINMLDYYDLTWSSSDNNVLSLLETENGICKGRNAYVTAIRPGEAIITLSHPKCNFVFKIWVIIPDKDEVTLKLDKSYVEIFKDDGSTSVTASITNGTIKDLNSITWTAPKVGGQTIISITKSSGNTCNIVPKSIGSTTLRAQLPNGTFADCIVSVLANAEIVLGTKAIHINPGFSEVINYTTTPNNVTINWISTMNTSSSFGSAQEELFTFVVNEAAKTITITGNKIGSGSLNGYFASSGGTASCILNVFVEYNYNLTLNTSSVIEIEPRYNALIEIPFTIYPTTLDITANVSDSSILEIQQITLDKQTGNGIVTVKPLKEGIGQSVNIIATNQNDLNNTPISKTQIVNSKYNDLHITPVFSFNSGSFSHYDNSTLYLSDGEDFLFYLDIEEENATLDNLKVVYSQTDNNSSSDAFAYKQSGIFTGYNNATVDDNHIFFSNNSNVSSGILEPESVNSNGKSFYRIGHNYDYVGVEDLYLVKGRFNSFINSNYKNSSSPWSMTPSLIHYYKNGWIIPSESVEWFLHFGDYSVRAENDNTIKSFYKANCLRLDSDYYAYNKNDFENLSKYRLYVPEVSTDSWFWFQSGVFKLSKDLIIHPFVVHKQSAPKDDSISPSIGSGKLTISYTNSSGILVSKSIIVKIEVRYCKSYVNGYWKKTSVDGLTCWKLINKNGLTDSEANTPVSDKYMYIDCKMNSLFINQLVMLKLAHNYSTNVFNWSVDDTSIASITPSGSSCKIKGLKEGTTIITVSPNNSSDTFYYTIDVKAGYLSSTTTSLNYYDGESGSIVVDALNINESDLANISCSGISLSNKEIYTHTTSSGQIVKGLRIYFTAHGTGNRNVIFSHPYAVNSISIPLTVSEKPERPD